MTTHHETGMGARLRNAQDLLAFITGFSGYNPPRPHESVAGFDSFLNNLIAVNTSFIHSFNTYNLAVEQRIDGVKGKHGLKKSLSLILGAVQSQYGKSSIQYNTILTVIRRIRASNRIYKNTGSGNHASISVSAQSYGSFTQFFKDLVTGLRGFSDYNPSNHTISITNLDNTCLFLDNLNNNVATAFLQVKNARALRTKNYRELSERVQRIKAYVKAQYGNQSVEYQTITAIKA